MVNSPLDDCYLFPILYLIFWFFFFDIADKKEKRYHYKEENLSTTCECFLSQIYYDIVAV